MNYKLKNGEAEPVEPWSVLDVKSWYVPHFKVQHAKKNSLGLYVVFDCSSKHQGISLNDYLLRGPDHINSLVGILMRFRLNEVAITCDIENMFYQFTIPEKYIDFLLFPWFSDDSMSRVIDYRMTVHLFGATSSPACTTYGLRTIATDHQEPNNVHSRMAKQF